MNLFSKNSSLAAPLRTLFSRHTRRLHPVVQHNPFSASKSSVQKRWQRLALPLLLASASGSLFTASPVSAQLTRDFNTYPGSTDPFRFQTTAIGDIYVLGNTLMMCDTTGGAMGAAACPGQLVAPGASTPPTAHNGSFDMVFVNTAPAVAGPAPFRNNSSSITVNLPNGSTVVFAGLYWGAFIGENNDASTNCGQPVADPCPGVTPVRTVNFQTPTVTSLNRAADHFDYNQVELVPGRPYQGFLDVTTEVEATNQAIGGPFQFSAGGIEAAQGANANQTRNNNAGWSLIIVFENPNLTGLANQTRTLTVYDGFGGINRNPIAPRPDVTFTVSGFTTPPAPTPVLTEAGFVNYEGDAGILTINPNFQINSTGVEFLPVNPVDDFVNSTISRFNRTDDPLLARNPNYINQMGFDIDTVRFAASPIPNGSTSATVTLNTSNNTLEGFSAGIFTLAISTVTEPNLRLVKRITNVTRGGVTISGVDFSSIVDDPNNTDDNASGFSQIPLEGLISIDESVPLQSGDVIEYTIYFLSDGVGPTENAQFCDPIPSGTAFVESGFGAGTGISVNRAGTVATRTNATDGDTVAFSSPLAPLPAGNGCPSQTNSNGAVTVNLGTVSSTTGNNFGFVRFQVSVN